MLLVITKCDRMNSRDECKLQVVDGGLPHDSRMVLVTATRWVLWGCIRLTEWFDKA